MGIVFVDETVKAWCLSQGVEDESELAFFFVRREEPEAISPALAVAWEYARTAVGVGG